MGPITIFFPTISVNTVEITTAGLKQSQDHFRHFHHFFIAKDDVTPKYRKS